MKYIFMILASVFIFSGCASRQCGIEEEAFNRLSQKEQSKICSAYSKKQAEIEKIREKRRLIEEQNRRKELAIEEKKVSCLYQQPGSTNVINISIASGSFKPYRKRERIVPFEFQLAKGEVKKVCFYSPRGSRACIWVTYQDIGVIWNIVPDYGKVNNSSYVDIDYGRRYSGHYGETITPSKDWFRGGYSQVHINGKYRGADMDFKAFIVYLNSTYRRIDFR